MLGLRTSWWCLRSARKALTRKNSELATNTKQEWVVVSGFSKFASRLDLDVALGDRVHPLRVEALVDHQSYFQGAWLLSLDPSVCGFDCLRQHLLRPRVMTGSAAANEPNALVGVPTDKLTVKSVTYVPGGRNNQIYLASDLGITDCTVRLRNVRYNLGMDAVLFFFRDFQLGPRRVEKIKLDHRLNQYLVHFRTPAEAEKAMSMLNLKVASGNVMHMIWYNCCSASTKTATNAPTTLPLHSHPHPHPPPS